jgi:S-adenosylmethionine synthetase
MESEKDIFYFASESVSEGHPDKLCDQVSDGILDACLKQDPDAKVAIETAVKGSILCLLGEITHAGPKIDFEKIARGVVKSVGYNDVAMGYDWESVKVIQEIDQ